MDVKQGKASQEIKGCPLVAYRSCMKRNRYCIFTLLLCVVFLTLQVLIVYPMVSHPHMEGLNLGRKELNSEMLSRYPLLVDWHDHHGFDGTELRMCQLNTGDYTCIMTKDRSFTTTNHSQAVLFYGTDVDLADVPLPRQPQHVWALMHEESPKNNIIFSFKGIMELFNYTSTFRRESNLPLATQYIRNVEQLESTSFMKSFKQKTRYVEEEKLAPIIYVQGDCGVPSDRDHIVKMLMKHINIDSYGSCLHNKDLPRHLAEPVSGMTHPDFLELVSKYKFAIAMENGICNDYITEKFWRPLSVGTIPIVLGSPTIADFTPSNQSIIDINKYNSIKQLVTDIKRISVDEREYNSYRSFKQSGGVTNRFLRKTLMEREWEPDTDVQINRERIKPNYPHVYTCKVCEVMHRVKHKGTKLQASHNHYGCPWPTEFVDEDNLRTKAPLSDMWHAVWKQTSETVVDFLHKSKGGRVKP